MMRYAILISFFIVTFTAPSDASSPTGWSGVVLPRGEYREEIKSMPIDQRPGRLLHVYGNSVRLRDQVDHGTAKRPFQQIILGTPNLRSERSGRN